MYFEPYAPYPPHQGALHPPPARPQRSGGAFVRSVVPLVPAAGFWVLGRACEQQGGHHSAGDLALWIAFAAAASAAGVITAKSVHSHPVITAVSLLAAGACTELGVATYATGWALPAAVAGVFALIGYAVMPMFKRVVEDREERSEVRGHERSMRQMELHYGNQGELIAAQGAAYRALMAERYAGTAMTMLENLSRRAALTTAPAAAYPAAELARTPVDFSQLTPDAQAFILGQLAKHHSAGALTAGGTDADLGES
jgi:hypothetical protein